MSCLKVGKITGPQGLKGEVRVYPYTEAPDSFEIYEYVYLDEKMTQKLHIEKLRSKKAMVIIKFKEINTVEEANKLKETDIYINRNTQGKELEEDEYYIVDLIGLKVVDEHHGELGVLKDILTHTAQQVYVVAVDTNKKELLIPGIAPFIQKIDLEAGTITVRLIEGMLE